MREHGTHDLAARRCVTYYFRIVLQIEACSECRGTCVQLPLSHILLTLTWIDNLLAPGEGIWTFSRR